MITEEGKAEFEKIFGDYIDRTVAFYEAQGPFAEEMKAWGKRNRSYTNEELVTLAQATVVHRVPEKHKDLVDAIVGGILGALGAQLRKDELR